MFQGFSCFFRFFASFCIGQISHQQHKDYGVGVFDGQQLTFHEVDFLAMN